MKTLRIVKLLIIFIIVTLLEAVPLNAQVSMLWESASSYGYKGPLHQFGDARARYFYVIDTATHECKIYDPDNFSLRYTLTSVDAADYFYYIIPDMNSNGHSEVLVSNYENPWSVRIRDLSTGANIYSWSGGGFSYLICFVGLTHGSNILKVGLWKRADAYSIFSSLVVYSLGVSIPTSVIGNESRNNLPDGILLDQNFPNPFNPSTTINFSIPSSTHVVLRIFNMLGEEVSTLLNEWKAAGSYTVTWDAPSNPSGVYFYRLQDGDYTETKKLIILR